jgi:predicted transcriptional regulator
LADLIPVAANVIKGTVGVSITGGIAGETVTAGQAAYLKASDGRWYKAQCTTTAEVAGGNGFGVLLNGASAGQPVQVQTGGTVTLGCAILVGVFYYCSKLGAGGIGIVGDLVSTNFVSVIGYGSSVTLLNIQPVVTGLILA